LEVATRDLEVKNAEESRQAYKEGLEQYLTGQTDKALKMWKRAIELDPTNDEAVKAIKKMEEQKKYE
jgi:DNA-binding SARP family transcriptional activator